LVFPYAVLVLERILVKYR